MRTVTSALSRLALPLLLAVLLVLPSLACRGGGEPPGEERAGEDGAGGEPLAPDAPDAVDVTDPSVTGPVLSQLAASSVAMEALGPLKKQLIEALTGALAEGPPERAISACQIAAPAIAAGLAGDDGLRLGRTSHRPRNPANAPEPWMEPLLAWYLENPGETASRVVGLPGGAFGYVEPIYTAPLCLSCHGSDLTAPVRDRLAELYPDDAATGFAAGELRGLFWVRVPGGG